MTYLNQLQYARNNNDQNARLQKLMSELSPDDELYRKLYFCGERQSNLRNNWPKYCEKFACPVCRRRRWASQSKKLIKEFSDLDNEDMAFATVVLQPTHDVADVLPIFRSARSTLRNIRSKHKSALQGLRLAGWMETDIVTYDQMPLIGSQRQNLISTLLHPKDDCSPMYIPTIHAIVGMRDLSCPEFRRHLSEKWPHDRQVHVEPFLEKFNKNENIRNLVCYSLKGICSTNGNRERLPWASSWMKDYFVAIDVPSGNFQAISTKIGFNNRHIAPYEALDQINTKRSLRECEPMPFIHDVN